MFPEPPANLELAVSLLAQGGYDYSPNSYILHELLISPVVYHNQNLRRQRQAQA